MAACAISPENAATLYALVEKNGLKNTEVVLNRRYSWRRVYDDAERGQSNKQRSQDLESPRS